MPETRPGTCNSSIRSPCCAHACMQPASGPRAQAWPAVLSLRGHRALSIVARATSDDEEYEPDIDCMERMEKSLQACEKELIGIRAGVVLVLAVSWIAAISTLCTIRHSICLCLTYLVQPLF